MGDSYYEQLKGSIQTYLPLGLPPDPSPYTIPPGLESTQGAVSTFDALFPEITYVWDAIKRNSESAADYLEQGVKDAYSATKNVVSTVYDDVTKPLSDAVDNAYWKVLLAVIVVGGALYFIGKTGAVKVNV